MTVLILVVSAIKDQNLAGRRRGKDGMSHVQHPRRHKGFQVRWLPSLSNSLH